MTDNLQRFYPEAVVSALETCLLAAIDRAEQAGQESAWVCEAREAVVMAGKTIGTMRMNPSAFARAMGKLEKQ